MASPIALKRRVLAWFSVYRGLPAPMYTIFAATVVNGVGIFVFPFLTLYLTTRLGMSQSEAGKFMFLVSMAYIPGNFIGGKLADRYGRKKVMVTAQVVAALLFVPCGFPALGPAVPWLILVSVFFDGITDPARSAMMTDITTPDNRRSAYSFIYLGHNLGYAIGSLIAGFLFEAAPSWLFWGNAAAALAAVAMVGLRVPETRPTKEQIEESYGSGSAEEAHRGNLAQALLSRPFLLVFTALTTWYGFVYAQHRFALPLQMRSTFGAPGAAIYGSLMTLNATLVILLSTPILAATKKWKPINAVALAGVFFAAGFGMAGLATSIFLVYLSTTVWTIGEIVNATNEDAYVSNHTPMSHRGRFRAILPLLGGLGWMISPPVVGTVTERHGIGAAWPLVGAVAFLAAGALWTLGRIEERVKAKKD